MLSAVAWARRGVPARVPTTEEPLDDESDDELPDIPQQTAHDHPQQHDVHDLHDLHDDDPLPSLTGNLMYYKHNQHDPNLTNLDRLDQDYDDESDENDFTIDKTDLMLVGARSDEEFSCVEVLVYQEAVANLYAHHDIPLPPVLPLCLAWIDLRPTHRGGQDASSATDPNSAPRANMLAVGTFAPYIEVYDLDVIDGMLPVAKLGSDTAEAAIRANVAAAAAPGRDKKGKKRGKAGGREVVNGHTDAVMCLGWSELQRNVLASGSADHTVQLWDLAGAHGSSVSALTHHDDKVSALAWHPTEAAVLATAGFDQRAAVVDVRAPSALRYWETGADAEAIAWDPFSSHLLAVSSDDGAVRCFDARQPGAPLWALDAHRTDCTSLSYNPAVPGLLATGSSEKKVKLWSVHDSGSKPRLIATKDLEIGGVFDVKFSPDAPSLLAAGGAKGKLNIWNVLELEEIQKLMPEARAALDDKGVVLGGAVAGMGALDIDSSDDEEAVADGAAAMAGSNDSDDGESEDDGDDGRMVRGGERVRPRPKKKRAARFGSKRR